ncbi:contact-dependent growth inhibition system immunity protein [Proteus terrae]|uniref:contact-dependent growth inhibition system immunity protein n=1 Tax=Proteus terrae TaxID=1574161 RepID=UPI000950D32E|nr:contact-dependent growth inhibition system immunity protein [Proteus terrae]WCG91414.1 contact-dependent growth inhibition system immunity protein [Proteus terrae]
MSISKKNNSRANVYFNNDYYIIITLSKSGIYLMDFKKGYKVLSKDPLDADLSFFTKNALIQSEILDANSSEYHEMRNDEKSYSEWIKKIIKEYDYKNKTTLFKNMNLCSVNVTDGIISIIPYDHLRLDNWIGKSIPNNAIITLKSNCNDEVLGASIKEAFTRCISRKV